MNLVASASPYSARSPKEAPAEGGVSIRRLRAAMKRSRDMMAPFRKNRIEILKQLAGHNYSTHGAPDRVPMNFIKQAMTIHARQIAAARPKVLVTPRPLAANDTIRRQAALFELAMNNLLDQTDFGRTLQSLAVNALISCGIAKIGFEATGSLDMDGVTHVTGRPFCDNVDLDDFVVDMTKRTWREIDYCANRYSLPLEIVQNSPLYDAAAAKRLIPAQDGIWNEYGETSEGDGRPQRIGQGEGGWQSEDDKYEDEVELWDVWLPRERKMLTLSAQDGIGDGVLRETDWKGPEGGPFRMLGMFEMPNNIMPLAPAMDWYDLHDLMNRMFRKCARQAERQKTVTYVRSDSTPDGEKVVNADDGDTISVTDPSGVKEARYGGVDNLSLAFLIQVKQMASYYANNLDVLGGLSPMAETATQEKFLVEASGKAVQDMQERMTEFTRKVVKDMGWYLWTDPQAEYKLVKKYGNHEVVLKSGPEDRTADFYDLEIDIDPYSLQSPTPQARLQALTQLVSQFIAPMAGQLEAQGKTLDFEALIRKVAQLANVPDLDDILKDLPPPPEMMAGGPAQGGGGPPSPPSNRPPVTTRRYERVNRPGASREGQDNVSIQTLLGANPQASERAAMGRPIS